MKYKKLLTMISATIIAISATTSNCFAAGKTIAGYKANSYTGISDAATMVNGVKSKVPSYTGNVKTSNISSSDFYDKTKCIKYWSSHGSNSQRLWGDNLTAFTYPDGFKWSGGNLEFAFLAACNQLDGNGSNPRAAYANAMIGNNAVRTVCGYHEAAPGAGQYKDAAVVNYFLDYAKAGESVKQSWILANTDYGNMNYCVLTHSGNVQYSRFEGFPGNTYPRPSSSSTTILRFSSANPGGTIQPTMANVSETFDIKDTSSLQISAPLPNYSLQAMPVNISIKDNINTMVLLNESGLKTVNGEIKDEEISMSNELAKDTADNWLNTVYNGIDSNDFKDKDIIVSTINVAEVNLDGDISKEVEKPVAYNVRYNNKFNGIPIKDDYFNIVIDDAEVIASSIKHNDYKVISSNGKNNTVTINEAASIVSNEFETNNRFSTYSTSVAEINVSFCDDDNDGIYDPSYVFKMIDGNSYIVNSLTGAISF